MAQSPPTVSDVDVVGYTQQRSLVKDPCSLAAKEAITERTGKLCSGMDSLSVALKLRQEHLLSENDLEAVRDFQWVKEAKNSRILQSVKNAITVIGVKGFQDFLSILGEYPLLHSVVTDLQGNALLYPCIQIMSPLSQNGRSHSSGCCHMMAIEETLWCTYCLPICYTFYIIV